MPSDEPGKQLHDKATRGIALSPEEQTRLQEWYTSQDQLELEELKAGLENTRATVLQSQIDYLLRQLVIVTNRIQEIVSENEALRRENAQLRRKLTRLFTTQSA